jgi:hypothetical protein
MGAQVKAQLPPAEKTHLEKAGDAQDKFVATIGDVVTRKLVEILEKGENEVARVSAAKTLLDWIRPTKGPGVTVNLNNAPTYTSHLNLPPPEKQEAAPIEVEQAPRQKVLPEPAKPMIAANLTQRTSLDELRELNAQHAPEIPSSELHRAQSPTPRTPDKPPSPASIRPFS